MRDGVEVAADVVLPTGDGPWPAVVNRTPYMRRGCLRADSWLRLVDYGYALVSVDVRGRGDSGGRFTPNVHDAEDGHDTIEWVAAQRWCTGRVGMVGGSYEARTQWWTAMGRPPHLCCIVPQAVGAATVGQRWSADTCVPMLYRIWWYHLVTGRTMQHPSAPSWEENIAHLPLGTLHEKVGTSREWWPKYVRREIEPLGPADVLSDADWAGFDVPALISFGWWDDQTTLLNWVALRGSPAERRSRLLIGAWDHAGNLRPRSVLGGLDVSASVIDVLEYIERFLAFYLKDTATDELPRCRVFRTGLMQWETMDEWPAPEAVPMAWHLDQNGTLSEGSPTMDDGDSYIYDPRNPARDFSSLDVFAWSDPPLDARYFLRREDVLVYTSAELEQQLAVSGQALFEGTISTDCPDTDLAVALYDVYPDGRSILMQGFPEGILRLSYRNGPIPEPLSPRDPVRVRIPITWLHHTFLPGHRIRLSITSSSFPTWARNLNSGDIWYEATESRTARVVIHRGPGHPSRLVLPVER
jgi:putative CocE/NonD family hydrolase